jgi:hypothetical protein
MRLTFEVTNTGDVRLDQVRVIDDTVTGIHCPEGGLEPGETVTCTAALPAPALGSQHVNHATATGVPVLPDGSPAVGADAQPVTAPQASDKAFATSVSELLPRTGADVLPVLALGLALIVAGWVGLLLVGRRRLPQP